MIGCLPLPWSNRLPRRIANRRFRRRYLIGEGTFGKVYSAVDTRTKQEVAVKVEDPDSSQLEHEAQVLQLLGAAARPQGFAEHFYYGQEGRCRVLIMEFLGPNLEDVLDTCRGTFQVKTTVLIAEQLLQRLEYLHSKGVVHRDIKPENFALGVNEKQHHLYVIDFGLSNRYYSRRHIQMQQYEGLIGTARYASISAHRHLEQSRRDDLEALGHTLIYFLRGTLMWCGLSGEDRAQRLKKVRQMKQQIPIGKLCAGFPREFERYLAYCRGLGFREHPDYATLRRLFRGLRADLAESEGRPIEDHDFEWNSGKELGRLEPLDLVASYPQPDDPCSSERRLLDARGREGASSGRLKPARRRLGHSSPRPEQVGESKAGSEATPRAALASVSRTEGDVQLCGGEGKAENGQADEAKADAKVQAKWDVNNQDEAWHLLQLQPFVGCGA